MSALPRQFHGWNFRPWRSAAGSATCSSDVREGARRRGVISAVSPRANETQPQLRTSVASASSRPTCRATFAHFLTSLGATADISNRMFSRSLVATPETCTVNVSRCRLSHLKGTRSISPITRLLGYENWIWRRERDSNPRRAFDPYTLSRGAPSTTRPSLRARKTSRFQRLTSVRCDRCHCGGGNHTKKRLPAAKPAQQNCFRQQAVSVRTPAPNRALHRALPGCCHRPARNPHGHRRDLRPARQPRPQAPLP